MRVLSLQTRDLAQLGALELDGESITEGFSDNKKLGSIDGVLELSLSASEGMEEDFILGANEADITLDGEGLGGLDAVLLGITDNNTLGTDDRYLEMMMVMMINAMMVLMMGRQLEQ